MLAGEETTTTTKQVKLLAIMLLAIMQATLQL